MIKLKRNILAGKINFLIILFCFFSLSLIHSSIAIENNDTLLEGNFIEIKILDKVSSKNNLLKIKIGE